MKSIETQPISSKQLTILGKYIESNKNMKYITCVQNCLLHTMGQNLISEEIFDKFKIISYVEEIAKITKCCPNFLKSATRFMQTQLHSILSKYSCYLLLNLTLDWLENNIDYKNDDPELFDTNLVKFCDKIMSISSIETYVTNINDSMARHKCECQYQIHITQKMYEHYPIGNRIDLVCDVISEKCAEDKQIYIDNILRDAFYNINSECVQAPIIRKQISEFPRDIRTKINNTCATLNNYDLNLCFDEQYNFLGANEYWIHKTELKKIVFRIECDNLICRICDSHIVHKKSRIITIYGRNLYIEEKSKFVPICKKLCRKLIIYFASNQLNHISINGPLYLISRCTIAKLFLLYGIFIQVGIPLDILKHISMKFLNMTNLKFNKAD